MLKKFRTMFMAFLNDERGEINTTGLLMMGIAMIFIAVGFIVFPIVITGTDAILAYAFSSNASITDASYTGLTAVVGITPLLVLIGFLVAAVVTGFMGLNVSRGARAQASVNPSGLLFMAIGLIFIAVGLIIFPVVLDGTSTVLHGDGAGIAAAYTGLGAVVGIAPLLVLIAFISAAVISGFFGVRGVGGAKAPRLRRRKSRA